MLPIRFHVRSLLIVLFFFLTYYTCFSEKTTWFLSATKLQATVIFNLDPSPHIPAKLFFFFYLCMSVTLIKTKSIDLIILKKKKQKRKEEYKAFQVTCLASMPLLLAHLILSWVLTAPPDPLRDLGTWQPSWPSLRSPIGAVTTHSALFVFPRTTQDLENKQWGQCHRYIMMSLNLASHSKDRGQTQRDARKGFISLKKKKKKLNKQKKSKARKKLYYLSPQTPFSPALPLD